MPNAQHYPCEPPMTGHNARRLLGQTSQVSLSVLKHFHVDFDLHVPIRQTVGPLEHCGVIGLSAARIQLQIAGA